MVNNTLKSRIDPLLISLGKNQEIINRTSIALEISKILLEEIGIENIEPTDEILYRILKLPNAERYDSWFVPHPYYGSERACFSITDDTTDTLDAKLYVLQKKSRSTIAGAVNFTPNWEDADYTRDSSTARIGIDFFLTPSNSLLVVLSNRGKLRIMELSDHMSNTQVEIFATWKWVYSLASREAIHITLWDALKLESVNNKFFEWVARSFMDLIQHLEKTGRNHEESKLFASRLHGRLLFVWFLRKKHIISNRFDYFTTEDLSSTEYYITRLSPLFFECLNTPTTERNSLDHDTPYLNGGLFDPRTDWYDWSASTITFPEGFFDRLYDHFDQFNFTTDESTPDYEQIAIDPEMLGRIFENLLATQVEATGVQARKAKWAFYTPREIVSYMCRESLRQYLYTKFSKHESIDRLLDTTVSDWAKAGTNSRRDNYTPEDQRMIIGALDDITILDPACGSGAYPMGILQMMLQCYERMDTRYDPYQVKLQIIKNNLYGVDIEPMAVEIARLRAWLSLIVDEPSDSKNVKPLPNLDFKFVCANSLLPLIPEYGQQNMFDMKDLEDKMQDIRDKYYNARTPSSKESLKQDFQKLLQTWQQSMFVSQRENQLKTYHPFDVHNICQFFDPEFMFGIVEWFDVVIGNPPYVSLEKVKTNKDLYKNQYETFSARWDLYCLFYERWIKLTRQSTGILSYITSNKWMRSGYGEKLRNFLSVRNPIILIDCWPGVFDSATVDTNILVIRNELNTNILVALNLSKEDLMNIELFLKKKWSHLPKPGNWTWSIWSISEIALKTKIEQFGIPIKQWDVKISYGIKTGLNEAFIIDWTTRDQLIMKDSHSSEIIKPILRWRDIKRYRADFAELYIIIVKYKFAHELIKYPAILEHLQSFEEKLRERWQCNTSRNWKLTSWIRWETWQHHWLEIDNNPTDEYLRQFENEKIIYPVMSWEASFFYDRDGFYSNDKSFIITGNNLKYLIAILNSKITHYYLCQICSSLGNAAIEYRKIYLDVFPVPSINSSNEFIVIQIESLVDQILKFKIEDPKRDTSKLEGQIDELVYQLYDLTPEEIAIVERKD
jgi:hypothetical protein